MENIRDYTRFLNEKEIKHLQQKYEDHMKNSRGGMLSQDRRKKLLHKAHWNEEDKKISSEYLSKYFYELRESTKGTFLDFLLLCDTLSSDQIREIFELNVPDEFYSQVEKGAKRTELQKIVDSMPSLENVVRSVLMSKDSINTQDKKSKSEIAPDSWKFELAYRLVRMSFIFLEKNQFITSKAHRRLIEETIDMLDSERHNTLLAKSDRDKFHFRTDNLVDTYLGIPD